MNERNEIAIFENDIVRLALADRECEKCDYQLLDEIIYMVINHNEILWQILRDGIKIGGKEYMLFTATTGQVRNVTVTLMRKDFFEKHKGFLMVGLTTESINANGGMNVGKYLSYNALSLSSSVKPQTVIDIDRCIVVEGLETVVTDKVKRFHSGLELGRISKTNGEDFNTVQRVGTQGLKSDEVPIIAQAGEAVVTEKQIENLAEAIDYIPVYQEILDKISEVANAGKMDEVAKMIPKAKYDTPKPKEVTQNNQTINVTQDINVNCPNVTNTTGAEYLVKALRKAGADVLVYNK